MQVFVYGTLKKHFNNHHFMIEANGKLLGRTVCKGYACINTPWYPYAIKKDSAQIIGELYEVPEDKLGILDGLEGYPNLYNRTIVDTPLGKAWIYYSLNNHDDYIEKFGFVEEWVKR